MNTKIYYEYWQMAYFNNPFKRGDTVEWLVVAADDLDSPLNVGRPDYFFKAHNEVLDGLFVLKGVVKDISVIYEKYEVVQEGEHYKCINYPDILDVVKADSSVLPGEETERPDFMAKGYVVEMEGVTIREAEAAMNRKEILSKTQALMEKAIPGAFERNQERLADILNMNDKFYDDLMKIDLIGEQAEIFSCFHGKLDYSFRTDDEDKVVFALLDDLINYEVRRSAESKSDTAFQRAGDPYNVWHKSGLCWNRLENNT